jgi:N-acetylglucosamine kinase-like BadF-type ATPase
VLASDRYRCDNDMLCSWAGSLGGDEGISVIAGTGSVAYGQYQGRAARAGGWSEVIGDEGSAYWIAREGMNLFSRMSDGRAPRGPLYDRVRKHLALAHDLDLCARVYGEQAMSRSAFAQLARLVAQAADSGDTQAQAIFVRAADELVECVLAVRRSLAVPESVALPVSHSGGVFEGSVRLVEGFKTAIRASSVGLEYRAPRFSPVLGAAIHAARLAGTPLSEAAIETLRGRA